LESFELLEGNDDELELRDLRRPPLLLLELLLETDNELANWRFRHYGMVQKMIGTRIGTGGSTGGEYLKGAMDKHYIFRELAQLSSFLIDRSRLPDLPTALTGKLGYHF
jgi:tryptophan 2,3-dioxygenase